jgi:hypothetical protein
MGAARAEVTFFDYPRLFVWLDPSIGVGRIGVPDAHATVYTFGLRGGLGIAGEIQKLILRFRVGYGVAPTFESVTATGGKFDFGGFVFAIDGGFRASR